MSKPVTVIVCTGRSNESVRHAFCPWCCVTGQTEDLPLSLIWDVFGGYCGIGGICGRCGYRWSSDDDRPLRDQPDEKRQENIARVAKLAEDAGGKKK